MGEAIENTKDVIACEILEHLLKMEHARGVWSPLNSRCTRWDAISRRRVLS